MKFSFRFCLIVLIVFALVSCEVSDVERNAKLISLQELFNLSPGFEWFPYEYNKYQPDVNVTKGIDTLWKLKGYKFILFVNPSCNCQGTQVIFPTIVKILKSGNVPDSAIIIYSMLNTSYTHPFMNKFKVRSLPACFTEIDTLASRYYSVVDTFELFKLKYPGKYKIEDVILMSLSQ